MEGDQAAVRRLRAEGRSYRQIAKQLGIPLTRAYKLGTAPPEPEPEPAQPAESEDALFGCAAVCSGDLEPDPAAPEDALFQVSTLSTGDPEPAPPAPPAAPPPAPAEPAPTPRGVHLGYLHGPFTMPTPEELARPYTMPGPDGTVLVITPKPEER